MPNPSFIQFENTYKSLLECEQTLNNGRKLSDSEAEYCFKLLLLCDKISSNYLGIVTIDDLIKGNY